MAWEHTNTATDTTCERCNKVAYMIHQCPGCRLKICGTCQPNGPHTNCKKCGPIVKNVIGPRPDVVEQMREGLKKYEAMSPPGTKPAPAVAAVTACTYCSGKSLTHYRIFTFPPGYWAIFNCHQCMPKSNDEKAAEIVAMALGATQTKFSDAGYRYDVVVCGGTKGTYTGVGIPDTGRL